MSIINTKLLFYVQTSPTLSPTLPVKVRSNSGTRLRLVPISEKKRSQKVLVNLNNCRTPENTTKTYINSLSRLPTNSNTKLDNLIITGKENAKEESFDGKIESYTLGKEIGHGSYAVVKRGEHHGNQDKEYAIKMYDKKKSFTARKKRGVMHEIQILKSLENVNIVKFYESIEDSNYLYLVFEYVKGGSLFDYLNSKPGKKVNEKEARRIFSQIVKAIQYCHHKNVVHRDLKLDNILLDENKNMKIIDFGFAVVVNTVCKLNLFCGTSLYMAPEIINRQDYWGPPVDIWSLGVILYTMLSGRFPFRGSNDMELYKSISRGTYINPVGTSLSAQELIAKLLCSNPAKRPTCDEILKDPFMEISNEDDSKNSSQMNN